MEYIAVLGDELNTKTPETSTELTEWGVDEREVCGFGIFLESLESFWNIWNRIRNLGIYGILSESMEFFTSYYLWIPNRIFAGFLS